MAKKCSLCKTGGLIESGCGCDNPACTNHVDKWKCATATYAPPVDRPFQPIEAPKAVPEPAAPEPEKKEELVTPAPKKRGRPKKIKE